MTYPPSTSEWTPDDRRVAAETLHVPRTGARSLEVLLVASPRFADAEPRATTVALLFDPTDAAENPAMILASRFGLSFEETQVIGQLLHGRSIPEIAATLGVTREVIAACLRGLRRRDLSGSGRLDRSQDVGRCAGNTPNDMARP